MRPTFLYKAIYDDVFTEDKNFYRATTDRYQHPALTENTETDIVIIGGGLSGLATAYFLSQYNEYKIHLLERHFLGWGASGRNGGQILPGYMPPPNRMVRKMGFDKAHQLWKISLNGISAIKKIAEEHQIDCNLKNGSIAPIREEYFDPDSIQKKMDLLGRLGSTPTLYDEDQTAAALNSRPGYYKAAIVDKTSAFHFHPLRYTQGLGKVLKDRINIYENTNVIGISEDNGQITIFTPNAKIKTKKLVLCGDSYLGTLVPQLRRKYVLIRNGMITTNQIEGIDFMGEDMCASEYGGDLLFYSKTFDNRLLIGGGDAVRPNSNFLNSEDKIMQSLHRGINDIFPQLKDARVEYTWGGYIGVTSSYMPYVGNIDKNVYYMGGYSGHGVNLTHAIGALIADAIHTGNKKTNTPLDQVMNMSFPGQGDFDVTLARLGMFVESILERFD